MILDKLFNKDQLVVYLDEIRANNLIVGFTNGCFDLLHEGHLSLLSQAKKKCDFLIVGINSDLSVKKLKGSDRPIDREQIRLKKLSIIKDVDALIVFSEETPLKIINELMPNILFKGADYKYKDVIGTQSILKNGGKIEFIDILEGFSTTNIIQNSNIKC
jgi:D-beta-D-heptose 7-phosphate kinase/D-beta-D-heptose 1-phosphate adenosyltransferase